MRKFVVILITLACVALSVNAQSSRLSFAAKGGMTMYFPYADVIEPAPLGEQLGLEFSYNFLWPLPNTAEVGIRVGTYIGYGAPNMRTPKSFAPYQYTNFDYLGNQIDYTISVNRAKQEIQQFQVGVPVMAVGLYKGFLWAVGVRPVFPFSLKYEQTLDVDILAYYPEYRVEVPNELVTGKIMENKHFTGKTALPAMYMQLGFELSYRLYYKRARYVFKPSKGVNLGLFGYFTCFSTKTARYPDAQLVTVLPITDTPPAEVVVTPLNEAVNARLWPFEIGLSASFDITYTHRYNAVRHHSRHLQGGN